MTKKIIIIAFFATLLTKEIYSAGLVLVINTLECSNYYRSAPLLTELKDNFDIKFIFPEYESKIAEKYLDQKLNLRWDKYDVTYNDSLYNLYRKNLTSECVYFPNGSKTPLASFPLSQLQMSIQFLKMIPGKLKVDTIPVPQFLFSGDMSFSFDSTYLYILEAQFGSLLQFNKNTNTQKIFSLPDSFQYENIAPQILTEEELKSHKELEEQLKDQKTFIKREISFNHVTCYKNKLYIKATTEFYRKDEDKVSIITRNFVVCLNPKKFSENTIIPLQLGKEFGTSYSPVLINEDTLYVPVHIFNSSQLPANKKYLLYKYLYKDSKLQSIGFHPNIHLPEEYQRLSLGYNFLKYHTYKGYFNLTYSKTIYNVDGTKHSIKLMPEIDTVAGSKIPEVKTNYMMLGFAIEEPITNFIVKFDDGRVKLFSYDYSNNLPFNQIELPLKIKTTWPNEDFFKFISINSFVHINLRNQFIVKYHW